MDPMDKDIDHLDFTPQGFKYMPCKYCGKAMLVGVRKRVLPHHIECSLQRNILVIRQMAAKEGEYYDRWLTAMAKRFQDQGGGGHPPIDPPGDQTPST